MSPRILIKFPSRSRPAKMFSCIENIKSLIGIEDYIIALALDLDDQTVNNPEVKQKLKGYDNLIVYWGLSKNKIDAVNRSIPKHFAWKYLVVMSDDMLFLMKDFGKIIIDTFVQHPYAGLLHFPDQKNKVNNILTLPVMRRSFYELFGYVYHPSYISVKADKEQMEVGKRLNQYLYVPIEGFVKHCHPRWGWPADEQNNRQENPNIYAVDGATFAKREAANFDL